MNLSSLKAGLLTGIQLGTFAIEDSTSECETDWSHPTIKTGSRLGAAKGYASLEDAVAAMQELTTYSPGSAAIMREGDRFGGYKAVEVGTRNPLELNERGYDSDLYTIHAPRKLDARLAALVDGRTVAEF